MKSGDNLYRQAVQHYLIRFCVPFVREVENQSSAIIQGSGTLVEFDGNTLFLTAYHVIKNINFNFNSVGIPINRRSGLYQVGYDQNGTLTLTCDFEVFTLTHKHFFHNEEADIAIFHLHDHKLITMLRDTYEVLKLNHITSLKKQYNFIITGFPIGSRKKLNNKYTFTPLYFETERMNEPPGEAKNVKQWDIFFKYGEIQTFNGEPVDPINLKGISGGAIWQFDPSVGSPTIWNPQDRLKLIGINTGYIRGKYTRGTILSFFHRDLSQLITEAHC